MAFRKYKNPDELQEKIEGYWRMIDETGHIPTEHGLALWLGVVRQTLKKWLKGEDAKDLQPVVQEAYDEMADRYMQLLQRGDKNMTPVVIFLLKQPCFGGYQDKTEEKADTTVKISFGKGVDKSCFK